MVSSPRSSAEFMSFAQDAPQPLSYPLVEWFEGRPVAVLEVFHPAPECAVEVFDDVLHRVGTRPFGLFPERALHLVQALRPRPAVASLEVIAQEVETSPLCGLDDARLGR